MIWYSTRSWISSTEGARFIFRHASSTDSAIRRICTGVIRTLSSMVSLALVMAAMILVISKTASEPLRLTTFIRLPRLSRFIPQKAHVAPMDILAHHILNCKVIFGDDGRPGGRKGECVAAPSVPEDAGGGFGWREVPSSMKSGCSRAIMRFEKAHKTDDMLIRNLIDDVHPLFFGIQNPCHSQL